MRMRENIKKEDWDQSIQSGCWIPSSKDHPMNTFTLLLLHPGAVLFIFLKIPSLPYLRVCS